jgi:Arc/MetJ-type ribon-helix-helix transcriptional regulator
MHQKASIVEILPDDLRETIEQDVQAGDFANADEAIREAIVSQHERLALRRSLIEADTQIERGEFVTPEESDADIDDLARTLQAR